MEKKICCKGNGKDVGRCEYDSSWFCRHPECKSPVLTSTLLEACPSGCPKKDKWNRRDD